MTKKKPDEERVRKAYSPRGSRGQKMVTFRCDFENLEYLNQQDNKGRFLNDLIKSHKESGGG